MIEPDELPPGALAHKDGNAVTLRCRTPGEAYLISDELEKADILAVLPPPEQLLWEYKRNGYVEVRVSARAYESIADLRSAVEFQYKRLRAEQPLPPVGKLMAMGCGVAIVPGVLLFFWLLRSYRENGYNQMAKDLRLWFCLGLAVWLLIFGFSALA